MRCLFATLALTTLSAYLAACGGTSKSTDSHQEAFNTVRGEAIVTAYFR